MTAVALDIRPIDGGYGHHALRVYGDSPSTSSRKNALSRKKRVLSLVPDIQDDPDVFSGGEVQGEFALQSVPRSHTRSGGSAVRSVSRSQAKKESHATASRSSQLKEPQYYRMKEAHRKTRRMVRPDIPRTYGSYALRSVPDHSYMYVPKRSSVSESLMTGAMKSVLAGGLLIGMMGTVFACGLDMALRMGLIG